MMDLLTFLLQSASCSTPTTPSYSQSLDLETRMLDGSTMPMIGSTMVSIPTHVPPPLHTVISGPAADCRHAVCPSVRPDMQVPTTLSGLPRTSTAASKTKMRGRTEDPCQIAPLKKRKIQVRSCIMNISLIIYLSKHAQSRNMNWMY